MTTTPTRETHKAGHAAAKPHGQRRRMQHGSIGINEVVRTKGITRAIENCRKRKEYKHKQTARSLKQYRKVMKQEGYDAGMGAGRKRDAKSTTTTTTKSDPFQKSLQRKEQREVELRQQQEERKDQEQQRKQKKKERRQRTVNMKQRSRKGQPIMKQVMEGLISKMQKNNGR
mmetsp:Transcript_19366/g.53875  ORF Transcript_19366/g.53875 Transcript_19366/m.53875 type:complete len:172 (-) Transcript_19366:1117-1632(-)